MLSPILSLGTGVSLVLIIIKPPREGLLIPTHWNDAAGNTQETYRRRISGRVGGHCHSNKIIRLLSSTAHRFRLKWPCLCLFQSYTKGLPQRVGAKGRRQPARGFHGVWNFTVFCTPYLCTTRQDSFMISFCNAAYALNVGFLMLWLMELVSPRETTWSKGLSRQIPSFKRIKLHFASHHPQILFKSGQI